MKTSVIVFFLFFSFMNSNAEAANINQGNWSIGGALNLNSSLDSNDFPARNSHFSVGSNIQYFFLDRLSLGLSTSYASSGNKTGRGSVSPIVTYYFYHKDTVAHYVSVEPIRFFKAESVPARWGSSAAIGTKIFLNDYIAVGPEIKYEKTWRKNGWGGRNELSFLGGFSIHL